MAESIASAIRDAYKGRVTQVDLGAAIGVDQRTISDWSTRTDGKLREWLDRIGRIEELAGRPRGWVLVQAGYVGDVTDLRTAIEIDPDLEDDQRETLLHAYDGLVEKTARRRQESASSTTER